MPVEPKRSKYSGAFAAHLLLCTGIGVGAYVGWRLFYFLTDDSFIAFRYVSNHMSGLGLVWNPPPFRPVEGYTSWLWVRLLERVWSLSGVRPPVAANYLSLAFGYGTLLLGYRLVARMNLPSPLSPYRSAFLALVMLGTITNRTFLAWLSSGLETSLFNFCFTLWVASALSPWENRESGWVFWLSLSAALTALTRPDGLLVLAGTILLLGTHGWRRGREPKRRLLWALPLMGPILHLWWRRSTYGEWLPNSYYAKYVEAWPESGLRYAASFLLEYAAWIWLCLAVFWLFRKPKLNLRALVVVAVLVTHFAYYSFVIGGDHFEYRVYSHLVLLLFISFLWLAARSGLRPSVVFLLFSVYIAGSWPLPWVHYGVTRGLHTREETYKMYRPIAGYFPLVFHPYAAAFDDLQRWLILHAVCLRHQEHKIYFETLVRQHPTREEGSRIGWEGRPVMAVGHVGVSGWTFPHVAIIDVAGLNDYFVARAPRRNASFRTMAHDRLAPREYIDCFRPNVFLVGAKALVKPRSVLLTDDDIVQCEASFLPGRGRFRNVDP